MTIIEQSKIRFAQIRQRTKWKRIQRSLEQRLVPMLKMRFGHMWIGRRLLNRSVKKRSVVFVHNAYYNYLYLAQALRERGWDAISVSVEDPQSPVYQFYHGEDVNLFHSDPDVCEMNLDRFLKRIPSRFKMIHFYGMGRMALHPAEFDGSFPYEDFSRFPTDFHRLRQSGIKIGYTTSGCNDGVAQSTFSKWSGCCQFCVFKDNPKVCSDQRNLAWGHKLSMFVDVYATEGNAALDYQGARTVVQAPLTSALDADFWRPDLAIPEHLVLDREPGEFVVFHSVGNFKTRSDGSRNIKGTHAVFEAIDRLKSENFNIRLEFCTDLPNKDVRFVQLQCDVVIDQLIFGRYGSTAREAMMLGRPVISRINTQEPGSTDVLPHLQECPIVSADVDSIYDVLKQLYEDPELRQELGRKSREYAVKWHSKEACAKRFEEMYDNLMLTSEPKLNS